jgi:3-oxoacyl-[acyl-carrier-protein] synthase-3
MASAVPAEMRTVADVAAVFGQADADKLTENNGVKQRFVVPSGDMTTSDLCNAAARQLFEADNIDPATVEGLIFVSQTPDYVLPATACGLQHRLSIPTSCAAFDVNLGCSGFVYGLSMAAAFVASGAMKRVLVCAGDTSSRLVAPEDRSTATLFGDAGTATIVEHDPSAKPMHFVLGSDGKGAEHLIIPAGGSRKPRSEGTAARTEREGGNIRSDEDLYMNGPEIFIFTLKEVPRLVSTTLERAGWKAEEVDAYVFHQANRFMLQHLAKKMKLPTDKVVLALEEYGNTSSASIPLAINARMRGSADAKPMKLMFAGFGVGYSWGSMAQESAPMVLPPVLTLR